MHGSTVHSSLADGAARATGAGMDPRGARRGAPAGARDDRRSRRIRARLGAVVVAIAALTCSPPSDAPDPSADAADAGAELGAGITLDEVTPLADLVARPADFSDRPVLVRGRMADVCQVKGCWTILQAGDARVRVRFADYGFFVPTDSVGAEALAEGRVEVVALSEDEARHYAAESRGGDPDAIDGPVREVSFVATGVRLVPAHGDAATTE